LSDMALGHTIRNHEFTRGFSETQMLRLASLATEVTFNENDVILETGMRSRFFYLVAEGSVAVELRTARFSVCVQALGPNDVFGWSSLLDQQDTLFQVRARERVRALRLDGARLSEACRVDTELGAEFLRRTLKVVAGRVKATEEKFAEMCGVKV
jgi:CRP/FNR family transcriptional regulator, cyclic AMP receptor protein